MYCKVCDKSFTDKAEGTTKKKSRSQVEKDRDFYKKEKKRALKTIIVSETTKKKSMTEEEREAFGELLEMSED